MYIVEKKEKIKINDVDRFEGFELFGRELDGISKLLLLIIAGLIAALIYVWFFKKEESSEPYSSEPYSSSSPESVRSEPLMTETLPSMSPKKSLPSYRSTFRRTSKKKSSR
jgi:hypothetical protein